MNKFSIVIVPQERVWGVTLFVANCVYPRTSKKSVQNIV